MPVKEAVAIRILSTTAGVVTVCVLRKSLPLQYVPRHPRDGEGACTVYI
jgi:hypothetical protein